MVQYLRGDLNIFRQVQSVGRCEREDLSDARISHAVGTLAAAMSDAWCNGVCAERSFCRSVF